MAVALDVAGTVVSGAVSPVSSSASITVGASASCLIVAVQGDDNTTTVTAPTWNAVSMTLIGTIATTDNFCFTKFYGLISPASGAKALSVAFSGGAPNIQMCAVSFTGSNTASVAACFTNFVSQANNTAGTSSTVTVTSAVGNFTIGAANGNNAGLTLTQTSVYNTTTTFNGAEARATGAATVVYTGTLSVSVTNTIAGVNIVAAAGGGASPFIPYDYSNVPDQPPRAQAPGQAYNAALYSVPGVPPPLMGQVWMECPGEPLQAPPGQVSGGLVGLVAARPDRRLPLQLGLVGSLVDEVGAVDLLGREVESVVVRSPEGLPHCVILQCDAEAGLPATGRKIKKPPGIRQERYRTDAKKIVEMA